MTKRSLKDWAAIAEILGNVVVIISLVFVVYSIQQNTQQLRVQNENYMFDLMHDSLDTIVRDPSVADIFVKVANDQRLSDAERIRYRAFFYQRINIWEMAYYWHRNGYLDTASWEEWDDLFSANVGDIYHLPHEVWLEMRPSYSSEFASHVDKKYQEDR